MMPRDAMKKDRLSCRVGQEIGREGHLLGCRTGTSHRNDHPVDTRLPYHPFLIDELGVARIDGRQRDDGPDPLPADDLPERPGRCHAPRTRRPADTTLTRFSNQSSRNNPAYASSPTLAPKPTQQTV